MNLVIKLGESNKEDPIFPEVITESATLYVAISPRLAQVEALVDLNKIQEEGYDKTMVAMASGFGKTYLSAFYSKSFRNFFHPALTLEKK